MRGTDLIAVLPSALKKNIMYEFSITPSPVLINRMSFFQIWHQRDHDRPLHQWMRQLIRKTAQKI